ncbi:MAG: hypothetical protein FWD86_00400 [Firmicutes bacterium]|nr:hypothetical protein [Bacillota bacterium]
MNSLNSVLTKLEELEGRVDKIKPRQEQVSRLKIGQTTLKGAKGQFIGSLTGQGVVGIVLSLSVKNAINANEIVFLVGGRAASRQAIIAGSGSLNSQNGQANVSFLVTTDISGQTDLALMAANSENKSTSAQNLAQINIENGEILVMGEAKLIGQKKYAACCESAKSVGLVTSETGKTTLFIFDSTKDLKLQNGLCLGFGGKADICGINFGEEAAVFAVVHKNLDSCFISVCQKKPNGRIIILFSKPLLPFDSTGANSNGVVCTDKADEWKVLGASDFSISFHPDTGLVFAFVSGVYSYAATLGADFSLTNVVQIGRANKVDLVKKSSPVAVIIKENKLNRIRACQTEIFATTTINAKLQASLS